MRSIYGISLDSRFYAESTRPHTPPSPEPFFSRKRMSLEITPLFALIGTIVIVATGAIVRNLVSDPDVSSFLRFNVPAAQLISSALFA